MSASKEPLNKSAAALGGSFAATFRFENLEIHKVFLRFSNLDLRQNLSLTALADLFRASLNFVNFQLILQSKFEAMRYDQAA